MACQINMKYSTFPRHAGTHEPVKSLSWSAMVMVSVASASLLDGIKAGDAARFELEQSKPEDLV